MLTLFISSLITINPSLHYFSLASLVYKTTISLLSCLHISFFLLSNFKILVYPLMECWSSVRRISTIEALSILQKNQRRVLHVGFSNSSRNSTLHSQVLGALECKQQRRLTRRFQPLFVAVENAESRDCQYNAMDTPLQPSSPDGKFLSSILQNHRYFFRFAVSEQLEELASDRERETVQKKRSSSSSEDVLHRRIAEMKENERRVAVEDVIYLSIVNKFYDTEVPMVPKLSKCITNDRVEISPLNCRELESVHGPDVQELVKEHLTTILNMTEKSTAVDGETTTKTSKLHLGRMYAASVLYGYFLKSACYRRELDLRLSTAGQYPCGLNCRVAHCKLSGTLVTPKCQESQKYDTRHEKLSRYIKKFKPETVQRCAKLKSKEAVNVIEKHTWALLYDDKIGKIDDENDMTITLSSIERLVLEAVAFGSFLWDIERSVDSVYRLTEN